MIYCNFLYIYQKKTIKERNLRSTKFFNPDKLHRPVFDGNRYVQTTEDPAAQ